MRPRLEDVARLANVHPATVSRALNERTRKLVSAETLDRVVRAPKNSTTYPTPWRGSLASARSSTIGVVIGDLAVPLFAHMIRGIDDVTSTAAYTALVVNTDNDPEREYRHLRNLEERRVDGLIVTTSTLNDPDGCQRFSPVAPVVNLLRTSDDPGVGQVISNDTLGMKLIMDHLFALGHSRIGLVAGPQQISTAPAETTRIPPSADGQKPSCRWRSDRHDRPPCTPNGGAVPLHTSLKTPMPPRSSASMT